MSKLGLFSLAAARVMRVRGRTWLLLGLTLLVMFGLLIWAALALMGWFFGQVQGWSAAAPQATQDALAKVEAVVPGARETVAEYVPLLKPEDRPRRDVSGTDFAPVERYPGLPRTYWNREGRQVTVQYEGQADYARVLEHYIQGFVAQGYTQDLQSASPDAERHAWSLDHKRYVTRISRTPQGAVSVHIETTLERSP